MFTAEVKATTPTREGTNKTLDETPKAEPAAVVAK